MTAALARPRCDAELFRQRLRLPLRFKLIKSLARAALRGAASCCFQIGLFGWHSIQTPRTGIEVEMSSVFLEHDGLGERVAATLLQPCWRKRRAFFRHLLMGFFIGQIVQLGEQRHKFIALLVLGFPFVNQICQAGNRRRVEDIDEV